MLCRKTFPSKCIHTEIPPLRFASVEMTKGRGALRAKVVAEQKPFSSSRWARRSIDALLKIFPSKSIHTEISPLRFASVEMILPLQNVSLSEAVLMRKGG